MRLNIEWDVIVAMFSMMAMLLKTAPAHRNIIENDSNDKNNNCELYHNNKNDLSKYIRRRILAMGSGINNVQR